MKIVLAIFLLISIANSANWLMLQGAQKEIGHSIWGFVQVRHEHNSGSEVIENGINRTPFSYITPLVQNQSEFSLARFRLGMNGNFDDANKINYSFLTEFAPNGINNPLGEKLPSYLTDASVTLKYLPLYIRFGKFKYPGSEEGMMSVFTTPFINFTTMSDQLLLERYVSGGLSKPSQGVGGYRDSGVELFQSYEFAKNKEITFAYMLGNGSGTANENVNRGAMTHYGYISFENILGTGKGYGLESVKFYAWMQKGKRYLEMHQELYDRERRGVGGTYFYNNLRFEGEYVEGKGMIGNGVRDVSADPDINDWQFETITSSEAQASGYYLFGVYGVSQKIDLVARYDRYDRITNNKNLYRIFETYTTGFSYKFKNYNRVDVNYNINSISAPNNGAASELLKAVGNQFSVQFTLHLQ
jgi:hypothetical protein